MTTLQETPAETLARLQSGTTAVKRSTLHIMDHTGDSRFMWDPNNTDETAGAKAQFDAMKSKGYLAYSLDEDGEPGTVISEFDPQAGAIIMTPQVQGG